MGNFGSNVIEHPGSSKSFTHQRARRSNIAADKHWSFCRFLHLALDSCETFADSADKNLQLGHGAAAHSTLRYAEEAFEEAQHYFHELNQDDGKKRSRVRAQRLRATPRRTMGEVNVERILDANNATATGRSVTAAAQGWNSLVRMIGLEPTLGFPNQNLNLARLPVSPHPHRYVF